MRAWQIQAHNLTASSPAEKQLLFANHPTSRGPGSDRHLLSHLSILLPSHCDPTVSGSPSLSATSSSLAGNVWLLLDPFSVTGTKGDSGTPSGTVPPLNLPHHHFPWLQPYCAGTGHPGVEFQTGGGARALSAFIFLLKLPGMSVFVPCASLGGDLAQRWPRPLREPGRLSLDSLSPVSFLITPIP